MRRWLILAHAWLGFIASLILVIVAVSGTLLVFKDDWTRLTVPGASAKAPLDAASLASIAEAARAHFGERVLSVRFASEDIGVHRLYLRDGGGAYLDADGRVVSEWNADARVEDWLLHLHYKLMAGEPGEVLTGIAALVSIVLVITGLIVWWPVRRNYRHRFWPASLRRSELLRIHRNTGIWSVLPIAVLSLSGAAMIFNAEATPLLHGLFGGETTAPPIVVDKGSAGGDSIDWRAVLAAGKARFPEGAPRIASWESQSVARIRYKQPSEWHPNGRSVLYYRAGEGVIDHVDAAKAGLGTKVNHAMYPVHSARIGGPLYAAVVALTGVGLTSLGLFGAWSFLRKPGKLARGDHMVGGPGNSHTKNSLPVSSAKYISRRP